MSGCERFDVIEQMTEFETLGRLGHQEQIGHAAITTRGEVAEEGFHCPTSG